jgi:hypothetical protein
MTLDQLLDLIARYGEWPVRIADRYEDEPHDRVADRQSLTGDSYPVPEAITDADGSKLARVYTLLWLADLIAKNTVRFIAAIRRVALDILKMNGNIFLDGDNRHLKPLFPTWPQHVYFAHDTNWWAQWIMDGGQLPKFGGMTFAGNTVLAVDAHARRGVKFRAKRWSDTPDPAETFHNSPYYHVPTGRFTNPEHPNYREWGLSDGVFQQFAVCTPDGEAWCASYEPFPALPMTITATANLRPFPAPNRHAPWGERIVAGAQMELTAYKVIGSDTWGKVAQGWILLEETSAGGTIHRTTWKMTTPPPRVNTQYPDIPDTVLLGDEQEKTMSDENSRPLPEHRNARAQGIDLAVINQISYDRDQSLHRHDFVAVRASYKYRMDRTRAGVEPARTFEDTARDIEDIDVRLAYHWQAPEFDWRKQAATYIQLMRDWAGYFHGYVHDVEGWGGFVMTSAYGEHAWAFKQEVEQALGAPLITYTNPKTIMELWQLGVTWPARKETRLWIAQYPYSRANANPAFPLEAVNQPDKWKPWMPPYCEHGWLFWQCSADENAAFDFGQANGVQSDAVDWNVFNGTRADLLNYFGVHQPIIERLTRMFRRKYNYRGLAA